MSEAFSSVQYCPFCGEEDLHPHESSDRSLHAAWECRSCVRVFAVRLVGLAVPR